MKRCKACNNQLPDNFTICPDCGKLLHTVTEEEMKQQAEEKERMAQIKADRLQKLREENRGAGVLSTIAILCIVLDVLMIALFVATANFGGAMLSVVALICSLCSVIFLKKPEIFAQMNNRPGKETDPLAAYKQFKTAATALVLIGLVCTLIQIGMQVSSFLDILSSAENI